MKKAKCQVVGCKEKQNMILHLELPKVGLILEIHVCSDHATELIEHSDRWVKVLPVKEHPTLFEDEEL